MCSGTLFCNSYILLPSSLSPLYPLILILRQWHCDVGASEKSSLKLWKHFGLGCTHGQVLHLASRVTKSSGMRQWMGSLGSVLGVPGGGQSQGELWESQAPFETTCPHCPSFFPRWKAGEEEPVLIVLYPWFWRKSWKQFCFSGVEVLNTAAAAVSGRLKHMHFYIPCCFPPDLGCFKILPAVWAQGLFPSKDLTGQRGKITSSQPPPPPNSLEHWSEALCLFSSVWYLVSLYCLCVRPSPTAHRLVVLEGGSQRASSFLCNFPVPLHICLPTPVTCFTVLNTRLNLSSSSGNMHLDLCPLRGTSGFGQTIQS